MFATACNPKKTAPSGRGSSLSARLVWLAVRTTSRYALFSRFLRGAVPLALPLLLCLALLAVAQAQPAANGQYQVYSLKHKPAAEAERILTQMLSSQPGVHVAPDASKNQLLVSGPQEVQELVRQMLASIDQPSAAAPTAKPIVKTYACDPNRLAETANALRGQFASRPDVRIAPDPGTGRLLVLAPAEIHEMLARQLAGGIPPTPPPSSPLRPNPPQAAESQIVVRAPIDPSAAPHTAIASSAPIEKQVPVASVRVEQVEMRIRDVLGSRLAPLTGPDGSVVGQRLADAAGHYVDIRIDPPHNALLLGGSQPLVDQVAQLVRVLDNPRQAPDQSISIVRLRGANARLRQAMGGNRNSLRTESGALPPSPLGGPGGVVPIPTAPDPNKGTYYPGAGPGINLVSNLLQAAGAPAGAPTPVPPPVPNPPTVPPGPESAVVPPNPEAEQQLQQQLQRLRQLGEDVEVETLPDLDVLILRGRQHDVEEMRRIIEEIERISAETEPTIEVYQLRHAGSAPLAMVIKDMGPDLTGARQGRAAVTPLIKPNALLIIGWGQALDAVRNLIAKLDTPVAPGTQLRVFRLAHAAVGTIELSVRQFFTGRKGMGTEAQIVADPRTNSLVVYAAPRDMEEVALLIGQLDVGQGAAVNQVRVFPLENSLAADVAATLQMAIRGTVGATGLTPQKSAALELLTVDPQGSKLLKSGLLNDVSITPDVRMNTLIISAPAESMELLAALVKQLDSPTSVAQIKVFHIVNGDASSLVLMLRMLLPSQVGGGAQLQLPSAEGESALTPLRYSVDIRTNSIIAVGSPGDLAIIEALLLRLDERDLQQRKSKIVRLKNAPANDVAQAINEYLRSERLLTQAAPGALNPFVQLEKEVVVVPEVVSNSLVISATPRYYDEIMNLINDLDAQPPMVLIQVLIGALDMNNISEFGVELGLQDSLLFDRSAISTNSTTGESTLDPGFNFTNSPLGNASSPTSLATAGKVAGQALSNFDLTRVGETGYSGLLLAASSESVSVLIRALQECRRLEVLARPQIMTLDNQPSFIQVGQRVPRISGSSINTIGQSNSIVLENVGLILGVTPRVSPEGLVVMEIDAERSELGSVDEGIPVAFSGNQVIRSPVTNLTMAQTTVSAADGETIILGGLINKNTTRVRRRVPWLSDIPVLGNLFRFDSDSVRRTELLIILTPHIVRTPKDAERFKQIEAARMHWCLADIQEIHGPTGIKGTQVVYPDTDPRGTKATTVPAGQAEPDQMELLPVPERIPKPDPILPKVDFPNSGQTPVPSGVSPSDASRTAPSSSSAAARRDDSAAKDGPAIR